MTTGPRIDSYEWAGGREAMLRWGPEDGPVAALALPLFEEANRTRATMTAMLELLAGWGIAGALPDLPGTGDSEVDTIDARLPDWRAAFAAAVTSLPAPAHIVATRGGALVAGTAESASRWLLSPQGGVDVVRELRRAQALGGDGSFAGNMLHPDLLAELELAEPQLSSPLRVVRLSSDPRPADAKLDFAPPWRTAEPARDVVLANALAHDLKQWIATCGG